jgi:hypothetical protein
MTTTSKQEYQERVRGRYRRAGRKHKRRILDEYCAVCEQSRKWAIKQLNRPPGRRARRGGAKRRYGPKLEWPLKAVWLAAQQPCGKRLKQALPLCLPHLPELPPAQHHQLLSRASVATLDRLLASLKVRGGKRRCGTKPGGLLKTQIPLRPRHADADRPRQRLYLLAASVEQGRARGGRRGGANAALPVAGL